MSPAPDRPAPPGAGRYARLAVLYLGLAVYGSLVPLQFRALPLGEALAQFRDLPWLHPGPGSRSDWATNVLLFIPLCFLLMAALCADRPYVVAFGVAPLVVIGCGLLSAAVEFAQLFIPARTPSPNDVRAETLGALLGALLWLTLGPRVAAWARQVWEASGPRGRAARLLPAYLTALILIHLMPLDLTISPAEICHKYRTGRVRLVPFDLGGADLPQVIEKHAWNVAHFGPAGLLLALRPGQFFRDGRRWPRILGFGAALAGGIEFLQLFVATRNVDITDVLVGALAVLAGWWAGRPVSTARSASPSAALDVRSGAPSPRAASGPKDFTGRLFLLAAWSSILAFVHWQPFNFTLDAEAIRERIRWLSWVPFADYYEATEYQAFDQILRKPLLFLPVGSLLALTRPPAPANSLGPFVTLAAFALASVLEVGQLSLPGRYPSITDILVETAGAWLGYAATRSLRGAHCGRLVFARKTHESGN